MQTPLRKMELVFQSDFALNIIWKKRFRAFSMQAAFPKRPQKGMTYPYEKETQYANRNGTACYDRCRMRRKSGSLRHRQQRRKQYFDHRSRFLRNAGQKR